MPTRKVLIIVGVVLVLLLLVVLVAVLVVRRPSSEGPLVLNALPRGTRKTTVVAPTTEYQNPFERRVQYVNPFAEVKSPFQNLQQ